MQIIQQNIPIAVRRRIYFTAVKDTDLQDREDGFGAAGWTVRWKKAGSAEAAGLGAIGEEDAADMPGVYYYEPTVGECDAPGPGLVLIKRANVEPREIPFIVVPAFFGTVQAGTLATTMFTTNLTQGTGHWTNALIRFLTGNLAGQVKEVGGYALAGGLISLEDGLAFTAAPAPGDIFELVTA